MNASQLKKIILQIVREDMRNNSEVYKPLIKECLGEMLMEQIASGGGQLNNSHKARALREASYANSAEELAEYPTMQTRPGMDRSRISEMLGYGDLAATGKGRDSLITVDTSFTADGNPRPISQNDIPESVLTAMNRDYRDLMDAWKRPKV